MFLGSIQPISLIVQELFHLEIIKRNHDSQVELTPLGLRLLVNRTNDDSCINYSASATDAYAKLARLVQLHRFLLTYMPRG